MCSTATRLSIGILTVAPAGDRGPPRGEGEFRPIWPNTPRGRNWIAADERAVTSPDGPHAKGRCPTRPIQRGWVGVLAVGGALHMTRHLDRREFIQLAGLATAGVAGVVFSSGLRGVSLAAAKGKGEDFMFLQMSDLHWG